jgi:Predicted membrane protein (DUF2142)
VSRVPVRRRPAGKESAGKGSVGARAFKRRSETNRARTVRRQAARRRVVLARASSLSVRALLARVPAAAWACALVALLNGAAWSIVTPAFQGRDEPSHFAYVQQLAETGTLPHAVGSGDFSPAEQLVLTGLNQSEVGFSPQTPAISSAGEQRALAQDLNAGESRVGSGTAGVATSEPPLYYALQTIPYALGGGNVLAQLELMRLTGALLAAITALLTFFFVRELLPGVPWAATAGALCVAVQPLFGFMSGTVNPDNLLFAVSAAVLLCLARAFRRGLTLRLALATGALIALGFLSKLNFVGLAFGVFAGLGLLAIREARARGRSGLWPAAIAAGLGAAPVALYALVNAASGHPALGAAAGITNVFGGSAGREIDYVWELYLPHLPGMPQFFAGVSTSKDVWFDRSVGLYGWIDTEFPGWVDNVALIVVAAIALLCARELVVRRGALRSRLPEFAVYCTMGAGVLAMVGISSYLNRLATGGVEGFADPRYLLPMLPLAGAVIALAVRGAGRRLGPAVAAALVAAFLAHDLFSQLQAIARYYG